MMKFTRTLNHHSIFRLPLLLLMLLLLLPSSLGCTCNLKHPQQHVCEADFVLTARIRRPTSTLDGLTAYKIRIKRLIKASEKAHLSLSKKTVYTIPGQCEVRLESKTTYVLAGDVAGGKPWISACSFAQPWRSLAPKMKKGFRLLYQTGCDCPIMSCHWWDRCPPGIFFCPWETSREEEDCQGRHGVCLRRPNGTCSWLGGRLYRSCMRNRTMSSRSESSNDIVTPVRLFGRKGPVKSQQRYPSSGFKLDKSLYQLKQG